MSDLPLRPDYDDGHDDRNEYGLVMPFSAVESAGGPFEDRAFAAGFMCGRIDLMLSTRRIAAMTEMVYLELASQLDLVAMRHGYVTAELWREDPWLHLGFTRND